MRKTVARWCRAPAEATVGAAPFGEAPPGSRLHGCQPGRTPATADGVRHRSGHRHRQ